MVQLGLLLAQVFLAYSAAKMLVSATSCHQLSLSLGHDGLSSGNFEPKEILPTLSCFFSALGHSSLNSNNTSGFCLFMALLDEVSFSSLKIIANVKSLISSTSGLFLKGYFSALFTYMPHFYVFAECHNF